MPSTSPITQTHPVLRALAWGGTFVAFPIGGLLATWSVGAVDHAGAALMGGAIVGAGVGIAQALGSRAIDSTRSLPIGRWTLATAAGMGAGLAAGASAVGFETSLPDLALMGAVTGVILGIVQALVLPGSLARSALPRILWAAATPVVLAAGWTVTTLAGVRVDEQFAIFGATGALVATALLGALLWALVRTARRAEAAHGARG